MNNRRYQVIFENSPLGMILFDPEGFIVDCNDQFVRLMGSSREELVGFHTATKSTPEMRAALGRALAGEPAVYEDYYTSITGGKTLYLRVVFNPVHPGSSPTEVIATLEDFSRRRRYEDDLVKAKEDIERYAETLEAANRELRLTTASRDELELEVRERKKVERQLRDSRKHYQELVENAASVILRMDCEGRITFFNEYAEILFGYSRNEVLGRSVVGTIVPEADSSGTDLRAMIEGIVSTPEQYLFNENENMLKDGRRIWVVWNNKGVYDEQGRLMEVMCVGSNITERKKAEEELHTAKKQAEAANRAKSEFLANMSHEIRTPMNALLGMAELLGETELDSVQRNYVDVFKSAGESLLAVINDILDLSKVESGKMRLESEAVNVRALAADVESIMAVSAGVKNLDFICNVESSVPQAVLGDHVRLKQILLNLVGNAVKFTDTGSISVHVSAEPAGDARAVVRFCITDTGIGISEDQRARIFDNFAQADTSTTRVYGGTGLGLAISRQLALLMGGDIEVESREGAGSSFCLGIPCDIVAGTAPEEEPVPISRESTVREKDVERILVVEDSENNRMLLSFYLSGNGYECEFAENGLEGLDACRNGGYDLVLMDMQMPVMDGFEATRRIRDHEQENGLPPVPIVALTAGAFKEDRDRCLASGCTRYLSKPIKKKRLLDCIRSL